MKSSCVRDEDKLFRFRIKVRCVSFILVSLQGMSVVKALFEKASWKGKKFRFTLK